MFRLSLSVVELLLAEQGVIVACESVRRWCIRFGQSFGGKLRRQRLALADTWHLDEVFLRIDGELHHLWRAVDQPGLVLDILVSATRNPTAAKRFFKRLLHSLNYEPSRFVADGLRSYRVVHRDIMPGVEHRQSRHLNNRAENSHRPMGRRER